MFGQIIEVTFTLVMAFLILSNADHFGTALKAVSDAYNSAVQTLQGPAARAA
jgi:hypothetical protein